MKYGWNDLSLDVWASDRSDVDRGFESIGDRVESPDHVTFPGREGVVDRDDLFYFSKEKKKSKVLRDPLKPMNNDHTYGLSSAFAL